MTLEQLEESILTNLPRIQCAHDWAEISGIPLCDLARICAELVSMTPADFMRDRRVREVQRLLVTTDMKCTAIAIVAGFRTEQSACRTFRKVSRMTMGEYRKAKAKEMQCVVCG
jgi:AraC-like DNA-binding protein